jgi:hypothetical protein
MVAALNAKLSIPPRMRSARRAGEILPRSTLNEWLYLPKSPLDAEYVAASSPLAVTCTVFVSAMFFFLFAPL